MTRAEERFWAWIEAAWADAAPRARVARTRLLDDDAAESDVDVITDALPALITRLERAAAGLSREELVALDTQLERKLYDLDRADVQAVTDGSDDGFLYARGFVVAMGRAYFEAVMRDPGRAVQDAECAELCHLPERVHEQAFGPYPGTGSGLDRASGSNSAGWPDDD